MQMNYETTEVNSSGMGRTQHFTIGITPESFKILSADLYSDPIQAVVREITCNAVDAHIAAGNPNPVRVALPTTLRPTFEVEDDGLGLSEDDVFDVYMGYFNSTKRNTNGETGGFGLGCKSPFAYSDAFTVVSRFNGTKSTYVFTTGEVGIPTGSKVEEAPTTERNGVRVSVPVKRGHHETFKAACRRVLPWLLREVEVTGDPTGAYNRPTPTSQYGAVSLFQEESVVFHQLAGLVSVRYLGVVYEAPDNLVALGTVSGLLRAFGLSRYSTYKNRRILLDLPAGSGIRPNPNRESIRFDGALKVAASEVARQALGLITDQIEAKLNSEPNPVAAVEWWGQNEVFDVKPHYRGIAIGDLSYKIAGLPKPSGMRAVPFRGKGAPKRIHDYANQMNGRKHTLVLVDDPTRYRANLNLHLAASRDLYGFSIMSEIPGQGLTSDEIAAIKYFYDGMKIIMASDLEVAPKLKREKRQPPAEVVGYLKYGATINLEVANESRMIYYQGQQVDLHKAEAVCEFMEWPTPVRVLKRDYDILPSDKFPKIIDLNIDSMCDEIEKLSEVRAFWQDLLTFVNESVYSEVAEYLDPSSEIRQLSAQVMSAFNNDPSLKGKFVSWKRMPQMSRKIVHYIRRKYPMLDMYDDIVYRLDRHDTDKKEIRRKAIEMLVFSCRDVDNNRKL